MIGGQLLSVLGLVVALALGCLVMLGSEALRTRKKVRRRMQPFAELLGVEEPSRQVAAAPVEMGGDEQNAALAWLNGRFPLAGGVRVTVIVIFAALAGFAAVTPLLVFVGMTPVLAVPVGAAVAAGLGLNIGTAMENGKRNEFNDRFLLAMEDFQRMVRFGIPAMQGLKSVGDAAEEPLKASMRKILLETDFGVPLEQAMAREARRVRMSELAMLAAIISTQTSTGGNLSEAVGNLAAMLRERLDNRAKMKASTAESRITLIILSVVPFLGVGLQVAMQPDLARVLLGEGRHLLGIGLALIVSGLVISYFMIRNAQR